MKHFRHAYSETNRWKMLNSYDSSEIFKELTTDLRSEVVCYVERANVNKIPFLRNKSTKFRADLILMMEPSSVAKGEKIVGDRAFNTRKGVLPSHLELQRRPPCHQRAWSDSSRAYSLQMVRPTLHMSACSAPADLVCGARKQFRVASFRDGGVAGAGA